MEHPHDTEPRPGLVRRDDGTLDWDASYANSEQWWSGHANASLVAEADALASGTALDVGCGEGADAIWLARRGWRVTGLDISTVALERARQAATEAGVEVEWIAADLTTSGPPGRYDLVSVHYPALLHTPDNAAIRALLDAVAPRGRLLFVGHDLTDTDHLQQHGIDPADYVQAPDVARHLGAEWAIEVDETRPRVAPPGFDGPAMPDLVLRVRRVTG